MSYRQKTLLKNHINLHHTPDYVPPAPRQKEHHCPQCTRSFTNKGNLIRHMEVHDPDVTELRMNLIDLPKPETSDDDDSMDEDDENTDTNSDFATKANIAKKPPILKILKNEQGGEDIVSVCIEDEQEYMVFEVVDSDVEEDEPENDKDNQDEPILIKNGMFVFELLCF